MPKTEYTYGKYRDSDSRGPKGRKPTPDITLTVPMRISEALKDILDSEKKPTERYNDTILRLLQDRTRKISFYRKKAEALQECITEGLQNGLTSNRVEEILNAIQEGF